MQAFKDIAWTTDLCTEDAKDADGNPCKTAHLVISDWKIPFAFDEWAAQLGFGVKGPEDIYQHCASRLTRPYCKKAVAEAATRLELDPGYLQPYEKMASFYVLRLLAGIHYKKVWQAWTRIPMTDNMLKDEIFCLCVVALHPELYGKLHPVGRNNRRVCLEAIALWRLPKFSLMQFAHPRAMSTFHKQQVHTNSIGLELQYHKQNSDAHYWVFDDPSVVLRVIGKSGARRWFELQFAGPTAMKHLIDERLKHGNSIDPLRPFAEKNQYVTYTLP